ncbi:M23 family metallopeptidase [Dyella acidiphila]|uniref:M23 family metallopeptidase n=1 Tax=Dyella acidiphila TaxID=2775866 RepID=A0ABR9G4V5_9GAMM|nr:M23 family metallopeptidase [Dyella acidiphila]MBE1159054.1 M23 family metallopeptidase [Dyella acidiphila]
MFRVLLALLVWVCGCSFAFAQAALAPVEARVPFAPEAFVGSDGLMHLAYELHITNFYGDTGPLRPLTLKVIADGAGSPLASWDAGQLAQIVRPAPAEHAPVSIAAGRRTVFFIWITLPKGMATPHVLRHQLEFATEKNGHTKLDGALVQVHAEPVPLLGPPLRGGQWLAHEGPGNAHSHHWGSLVAVNGDLTIPQRYALDLVGVDAQGHAIKPGVKDEAAPLHASWVGYGADVLAVADGVVRSARDGQEEHPALSAQPEPASLTADGLFGNYVVLELKPGVYASYAHLQRGSVKVKPGDRVHRGDVLGRLGQSGNSAAPHLHFQLSNAAAFEGSEGIPYAFDHFDVLGPETEAQLFGQGDPWQAAPAVHDQAQLPLSDVVIRF